MMGRKALGVVFVVGGMCLSCSSGETETGSLGSRLQSLRNADAQYTFLFHCDKADGIAVSMMLNDIDVQDPCTFIGSEGESEPGPDTFNFIRLTLNAAAPGTFQVQRNEDELDILPSDDLLGDAGLTGIESGTPRIRIPAVSGTVTVSSVPQSPDDWNAGVEFAGSLSLAFPVYSVRQTECSSGSSMDYYDCTCVDQDGNTSECQMGKNEPDCCTYASEETVELEVDFQATQCLELCSTVPCIQGTCDFSCEDLN